tara:strand:+ start:12127 stop:12396 length:270 start_codon:yes stop_codon:yes gene_type:complete
MGKSKTKPTKVTQDELNFIQNVVRAINNAQMDIGNLELQKSRLVNAVAGMRKELSENQLKLKEKYGDVNIDITDGSIKPAEDGEINKKN